MEWWIWINRWILFCIRYSRLFQIHFKKKHGEDTNNPSVQIYVKKIENRITFKIKDGYTFELLTPDTMKLLGSSKSKISKEKNVENVPHLEITEVVLIRCNMINCNMIINKV